MTTTLSQKRATAPAPTPTLQGVQGAPSGKQFLTLPFEFKAADDAAHTFEGYSATWDLDLGNDIIHPGAFKRTIGQVKRSGKAIPLLDSHSYYTIFSALGTLVDAAEDEKGLWSKWALIDGDDGERVMARLRAGAVRKMSIGYVPIKYDFEEIKKGEGKLHVRNLREVAWEETSLVIFPMQPNADVDLASVKSITDALRAGTLTPEQKAELRALLDAQEAASAGTPADAAERKGLAPDDPERLRLEALFRDLTLRSLGTR